MYPFNPGWHSGRAAFAPQPSSFTPASLSPSLWIEPAQSTMFQSNVGSGTGSAANGDNVGYIADLSGNGFHLTSAADDATRPTLQGVGVKPYLAFTSTQTLLRLASTGAYAAGSASWFITIRVPTGASGNTILGEFDTGSANSRYQLMTIHATSTSSTAQLRNAANTTFFANTNVVATGAFSTTVDHVTGVIDNGTQLIGYVDGAIGNTVAYTRTGTVTLNKFNLNLTSATRVYGLVCVNRVLTSQEISDLTTYMAALK